MKLLTAATAAVLFVAGAALAQPASQTPPPASDSMGTDTGSHYKPKPAKPRHHRARHHAPATSADSMGGSMSDGSMANAPVRGGSQTPGPGNPMGTNLGGASNQGTATAPSNSQGTQGR